MEFRNLHRAPLAEAPKPQPDFLAIVVADYKFLKINKLGLSLSDYLFYRLELESLSLKQEELELYRLPITEEIKK